MIKHAELLSELSSYFDSIFSDRQKQDLYYDHLHKKGMNRGRFNSFVLKMVSLTSMTEEESYWFASFPGTKIEPKDYFSASEIKKYSVSKVKKEESIYPIVFENVLRVSVDQYVTTISTKQLYKMYTNNMLVYNTSTQRSPKIYYQNGKEMYKINVNLHSVKEIRSLIERGLFIPNELILNIRDDDPETKYTYREGELQFILKSGTFDILDGFHRIMAIIQVMITNPEFDEKFILSITNFSEEKARRHVAQQDKRNKINSSYSKSLDSTRFETLVANRLNESTDSILYGEIRSVGKRNLDYGKTIDAIKSTFNPKNMSDVVSCTYEIKTGLQKIFSKGAIEKINDKLLRLALSYISIVGQENCSEKEFQKIIESFENKSPTELRLESIKTAIKKLIRKEK